MSDQTEQLERESAFAKIGLQVVNNEAFKQALVIREAQIFETFCNTKVDQQDVRDEAWRTMANMRALEKWLKKGLTTGDWADKALEKIKKAEEIKNKQD